MNKGYFEVQVFEAGDENPSPASWRNSTSEVAIMEAVHYHAKHPESNCRVVEESTNYVLYDTSSTRRVPRS